MRLPYPHTTIQCITTSKLRWCIEKCSELQKICGTQDQSSQEGTGGNYPSAQGVGDSKSKCLISSDFPGLITKPPFPVRLSLRGLHVSPYPRTFEIFALKMKKIHVDAAPMIDAE